MSYKRFSIHYLLAGGGGYIEGYSIGGSVDSYVVN